MENEQMNPSYEQLAQAYTMMLQENQQLKMELNSYKNDNVLQRVNMLINIIETFKNYQDKDSETIVKNAKWNLNKMLEKPKK